jgi:hypothetical protein
LDANWELSPSKTNRVLGLLPWEIETRRMKNANSNRYRDKNNATDPPSLRGGASALQPISSNSDFGFTGVSGIYPQRTTSHK